MTSQTKPLPDAVTNAYARYPLPAREHLLALRTLIYAAAGENPAIGPLTETLKWGEPSYLTVATKSGTTIRLAWKAKNPDHCGLYVNCQTSLVADWKELYNGVLNFEGDRAIIFEIGKPYPVDAVRHCIALALTYHLRKR